MKKKIHESDGRKIVVQNRKARFEYDILETVEAGLVLTGTEIKSIRAGSAQLRDAHVRLERDEAWLHGMYVAPYEQGNRNNVDPDRPKKLLLHRREIDHLTGQAAEKSLALIPLSVYLRRGMAKVEIALGRGRKLYDRRQALAERDARREQARAAVGRD